MSSHASPTASEPAPVFAALGDPTRLALVAELADGRPRSLTALAKGSNLTRQAVSKHLRVLESAGLVTSLRVGRETRYAFRPEPLTGVLTWFDEIGRQWDDALDRLKSFVED